MQSLDSVKNYFVAIFIVENGVVRCCLYIPTDQRILLFNRLTKVHKEDTQNKDGEIQKLTADTQEIEEVIKKQLDTLKHHFDANDIPVKKLVISCIVCVGTESNREEIDELLNRSFEYVQENLQDVFKSLDFKKVLFNSEKETFPEESSKTIKSDISRVINNDDIKLFVPYQIAVKKCKYQYKEFPLDRRIKLDSAGIEDFLGKYFEDRDKKIITLPDFDRIKCTRMFPDENSTAERNNWKPNHDWTTAAMSENGGMFAYIGEIEEFWPHFHDKWFPNAKGVLMHSFCEEHLNSISASNFQFRFEFDWLYWSQNHVILFEVGMKEKDEFGKVKDGKIKENIKDKLSKAFKQYLPVLKILYHYLVCSSQKVEEFENSIKAYLSIVLFLPSVDHQYLRNKLKKYLEGKEFSKNQKNALELIYFAGKSRQNGSNVENQKENGVDFYRYDVATKQIKDVKPTALLDSDSYPRTEEDPAFKQFMGLIAITYFCTDDSKVIGNFEQGPGSLLERFKDAQKKFIAKAHGLEEMEDLDLDVILSPQQFGILLEDEKYVRCVGESGSGKTEILLAKALISSLKEEVKHVYFCLPKQVTSRTDTSGTVPLMGIVQKYKNDKKINKMRISTGEEIYNELIQLNHADLSKTVVVIDEFQDKHINFTSVSEENFKKLSREVFPYLRSCWIASATLRWSFNDKKTFSKYSLYEYFCMRPMNITFRSSGHIARFCNNLALHQRNINYLFGTSRVKGVFTSKQTSVEIDTFAEEMIPLTSEEAEASSNQSGECSNVHQALNSDYDQNRWFVVLCSQSNKEQWYTKLENVYEISKKTNKYKRFVISWADGPAGCEFRGGEAHSVIIYIDGPEKLDFKSDKKNYFSILDMLLIACSRAQFELIIRVRDSQDKVFGILEDCQNGSQTKVSLEENLQSLCDSRQSRDGVSKELLSRENGLIQYILQTIEHRPIPPTVIQKLQKNLGDYTLLNFLDGHDNRFTLLDFGQPKSTTLLTLLLKGKDNSDYQDYRSEYYSLLC